MSEEITATKLKATLLGVLDDVSRTGKRVVVTKHGRAVAELGPPNRTADLSNLITFMVDEDELIAPIDVQWNALEQ
jgi:prevent-host-death family protein